MKKTPHLVRFGLVLTLIFILIFLLALNASAQQEGNESEEVSISGSVDTYFHKSFQTIEKAPRTSFSNLPGFSLGMVNLAGMYKGKKSGVVIDLVFGPRGSDAVFNAPLYKNASGGSSSQIINQLYVYYQVANNIRVNLGQFNTFVGYEAIAATKNFHYSTSYLFSYGPFNHTGVWADFNLKNGWSMKTAIMNPTDYTEFNPFDSYTLGTQIGVTKKQGSLYLNATYGDPDGKLDVTDTTGCVSKGNAFQVDLTASLNISRMYSVGVNTSYRAIKAGEVKTLTSIETSQENDFGFYGFSVYQKISFSESVSVGLRSEYFSEFNSGLGAVGSYSAGGNGSVFVNTLSANLTSSNFRFIPELRLDKTSRKTFTNADSGSLKSSMVSVNLAVVYVLPVMTRKINIESK